MVINSPDGNDPLSKDEIVIVSSEPAVDWETLGDLSSIEIFFSHTASTADANLLTTAEDQPEANIPNLGRDCTVDDENDGDDSLFADEEIRRRFGSHDNFGFGCQC